MNIFLAVGPRVGLLLSCIMLATSSSSQPTSHPEAPVFAVEPEPVYYVVKGRPVTLTCRAAPAIQISVKCGGQWISPTQQVNTKISVDICKFIISYQWCISWYIAWYFQVKIPWYQNENIKLLFFVIYLHLYCILHLELLVHHRISSYTVIGKGVPQWSWRPRTCFLKDGMTVNSPWIWRFLKSAPLIFHVFIAVAVMV